MDHFLVLVHSRIWLYYHSLWLAHVQLKGLSTVLAEQSGNLILELTRYEQ